MLCASACLALALLAADSGVARAPFSPPAPDTVPVAPASRSGGAPVRARLFPAMDSARAQQPVEYSDAYFTRLTIHRYASYATVPLFVAQYLAGEELMRNGSEAAGWARDSHGALAAGVGALFVVNTVTGGWNLLESRKDPEGRTRRMLHGLLMLAADAGFAATGMLADAAEESGDSRNLHRTVAVTSMGVSLASYAIMLPIFGND